MFYIFIYYSYLLALHYYNFPQSPKNSLAPPKMAWGNVFLKGLVFGLVWFSLYIISYETML